MATSRVLHPIPWSVILRPPDGDYPPADENLAPRNVFLCGGTGAGQCRWGHGANGLGEWLLSRGGRTTAFQGTCGNRAPGGQLCRLVENTFRPNDPDASHRI